MPVRRRYSGLHLTRSALCAVRRCIPATLLRCSRQVNFSQVFNRWVPLVHSRKRYKRSIVKCRLLLCDDDGVTRLIYRTPPRRYPIHLHLHLLLSSYRCSIIYIQQFIYLCIDIYVASFALGSKVPAILFDEFVFFFISVIGFPFLFHFSIHESSSTPPPPLLPFFT